MAETGLSIREYRELLAQQKSSRPKYKNRRQHFDGIFFDSGAEVTRYCELRLLEKAGEISGLQPSPEQPKKRAWRFLHPENGYLKIRSPRYPGGRTVAYRPDFTYIRKGKRVVEDVKGNASVTNLYETKLKHALMELFHGLRVDVVEVGPLSRRQAIGQDDSSVRFRSHAGGSGGTDGSER